MKQTIKLGSKTIGQGQGPFIIAEAGSNHDQSFETAIKLIDVAADAGADAVKFQVFQAGELYPPGTEMHKIFKSVELNADWLSKLNQHAKKRNILFLASAFDRKSVDLLEAIEVPAHKIASSETTNIPLLAYIAKKKRPMLISTGMCDLVDVFEATRLCQELGNDDIALFQCGAMYPLPVDLAHLRVMDSLRETFRCPVGFSDHTLGIHITLAAVARGADMIEKHFTLDRNSKGPDHFYALEPKELTQFVKESREIYSALGSREKQMLPEEKRLGRRDGLYLKAPKKRGEKISAEDLETKRPAVGIRARYKNFLQGAVAKTDLNEGAALEWQNIDF